ncbi:prodigiosin biosynthesis protein PigM [Serratia sp. JUb9]|uniref:prodigiosin biosynthesis protein PigM n=1 Tax=unclassified Serratia (in: enterobacteria) TaxID=2647522 RepID=UPI000CF6DF98|nr:MULTISPECIES: prodigiosin biosynthesis protein PigM [unclassified Serratia (in: enterobacteria)]MBU3894008.1 prodigiosin biosynthesis protein PigM [Serratia rubidaea]AVJ19729.1 prodigiosin biosynthesis protein PigM [Serratia sp. MYb239]QNK32672.1 prodigiosin biosynthesis protein PigM [Serratia sp. JUb9]QPT12956.1 prodigiosin biosynthesis protein PigM [Serratia rubidaea]SQJ31240.1 Nitroreductase family [Serratia rubidaea]
MMHESFVLALQHALDIARLAPSSHNCQPWSVHYDVVTRCGTLAIDRRRALCGLPSLEREMLMSCGIFFEYLSALLGYAGRPIEWRWVGDGHGTASDVLIAFSPAAERRADADAHRLLTQAIAQRHTARSCYQPTRINDEQYIRLKELFAGTAATLSIEQDASLRADIAQLIARHAALDFADRRAWQETYQFIRFDERRPADDGFCLHHLFGPVSGSFKYAFRLAFHPRLHRFTTGLRLPERMAKGLADLVAQGPQYLAIGLKEECNEALFMTGMRLGRLWLVLQDWGWGLHPLSVLVQHAAPRRELAAALALDEQPVFFARFGHLQQPGSATPRRSWQNILTASRSAPPTGIDTL